jgi:ATP-dependent Clp protease protease subunit
MNHSGQTREVIERDTERDFYMDGEAAKAYGIVDHVLVSVSDAAKA